MYYGREFASAFQEAMETPEYWMEEVRLDFIEELESLLEKKKISQTALARKLGKSDAYISKVMNSSISNFTLRTMVQLAIAAGGKISLAIEDVEPAVFAEWDGVRPVQREPVLWEEDARGENLTLPISAPITGAKENGCKNTSLPFAV